MIAILVFLYDLKYIEIRILSDDYPDFIEVQNQYDECIKRKNSFNNYNKIIYEILKLFRLLNL